MSMYYTSVRSDELYHHGVMGMKWGVRRYQNSDGTLTSAGKKKRRSEVAKSVKISQRQKSTASNESEKKKGLTDKQKRVLKTGAKIAVAGLVVYGGYKILGPKVKAARVRTKAQDAHYEEVIRQALNEPLSDVDLELLRKL